MHASRIVRVGIPLALAILLFIGLFLAFFPWERASALRRMCIFAGAPELLAITDGFKARMAELGYAEGRDVSYDIRQVNETDVAAITSMLADFRTASCALALSFPTGATIAAQKGLAGSGIPLVFAQTTLGGNGIVEDLERPGGTVTGVRSTTLDLIPERLALLRALAPETRRVGVLYDESFPPGKSALERLRTAASNSVELVEVPLSGPDALRSELAARSGQDDPGFDALFILPEFLTQSPEGWTLLTAFARRERIPIAGMAVQPGDDALFTYIPNTFELGVLAAGIADRILKGERAGNIAVLTPRPYLRVSARVAGELGLVIPERIAREADEIIRY